MKSLRIFLKLSLVVFLFACSHPEKAKNSNQDTSDNRSNEMSSTNLAVAHPHRPQKDLSRDAIRSPTKVLEFFDIKSGDNVVELIAGGGYYTELLSRSVGKTGKVYMQNNKRFFEFQTDKSVVERLANNRLENVIRLDSELSNLQIDDNSIDTLLMILVLHDFFWMEQDINTIIQGISKTLKPGGTVGIIDHSAITGTGTENALSMDGLHRIDKSYVIKLMLEHGFILDGESEALTQVDDDRTKAFFSKELKGKPTDRFMIRFKKPTAI